DFHVPGVQTCALPSWTRIVHIDADDRDAETTRLLVALHRLVAVGPDLPRARRTAGTVVNRLDELIPGARPLSGRLRRLVSGRRQIGRAAWRASAAVCG